MNEYIVRDGALKLVADNSDIDKAVQWTALLIEDLCAELGCEAEVEAAGASVAARVGGKDASIWIPVEETRDAEGVLHRRAALDQNGLETLAYGLVDSLLF